MTVEPRSYSVARRAGAAAAVRGGLAEAPGLPAQAAALIALLYLAGTEGGYYPTDWYPVGLVAIALLALWVGMVPPRGRPGLAAVAAALLVVFGAWALVSLSWADQAAAAWDGANRALLYAALFSLFAFWPLAAREARLLVALLGLGIALIGAVELIRWAGAADPTAYMLDGRLSEPVGYQNGDVALWMMGAFACLWLAATRDAAPVPRGLALGAVPLLGSLAWLGQSRGSLFTLPLALLVFLAVTPDRLRVLAALVPCALAMAVALGPTLDIIDVESPRMLPALVDDATRAILLPAVLLAGLGALVAVFDRRFTPSPSSARRIRLTATALVIVVAAAGVVVAVQADVGSEVSERWDQFKSNESEGTGSSRLSSGGTNRYDFWTVAWDAFEREPVRGLGMDNFQLEYALNGSSTEKPRFPHSFELAVLSQTGVVGGLLMLAALSAAVAAAYRAPRRLPRAVLAVAGPAAASLGVFAAWLLHTSVDWLYELPGLGGIAFAMLGLATAVREGEPNGSRPMWGRAARLVVLAGVLAAAISFALPWLAEREVDRALDVWRADPQTAYDRLDRAGGLNPLSTRPQLVEGAMANQLGEPRRAERAYRVVVDREPRDAFAWMQLAVLASTRQDERLARRYASRAAALSPRDKVVKLVRRRIASGRKITPQQLNREVLNCVVRCSRTPGETPNKP
jgi:hypothetical protein